MSRDDLVECAALLRAVRRGELDAIVAHDAPLDVLAQQIVAEERLPRVRAKTTCSRWSRARLAVPRARRATDFDAVVAMAADGFATRRGRRARARPSRRSATAACAAAAGRGCSR